MAPPGAGSPMTLHANDQTTYKGRVLGFVEKLNPLMLLASEEEIKEAQRVMDAASRGAWKELKAVSQQELHKKVLLAEASVNASTGEIIPGPLRFGAFSLVNIPICAGLLLTAPTVANSIFWQWVNQTYNASFNYANGNHPKLEAERKAQEKGLLKGYGAAVVASVSLAVGLNTWLRRAQLSALTRRALQASVPFLAVAGANTANVFCMRAHECREGIPVYSESGKALGVSKKAGFQAVKQTAISRVALPLPVLLLPAPMLSVLNTAFPLTASNAFVRIVTELATIVGCLNVALPLAVGIFPSTVRLPVEALEEEFHKMKDTDGRLITHVVFNRGV